MRLNVLGRHAANTTSICPSTGERCRCGCVTDRQSVAEALGDWPTAVATRDESASAWRGRLGPRAARGRTRRRSMRAAARRRRKACRRTRVTATARVGRRSRIEADRLGYRHEARRPWLRFDRPACVVKAGARGNACPLPDVRRRARCRRTPAARITVAQIGSAEPSRAPASRNPVFSLSGSPPSPAFRRATARETLRGHRAA